MHPAEGGEDESSVKRPAQTQLICGLPDDIALSCLARIPWKYHGILKCVSKRWRELVCSDQWHSYRRKHNLDETLIYALCKDKSQQLSCYVLDLNASRKNWKRIQDLPPRCLRRKGVGFQVLGKKVYLFGGCGWVEESTDEVYCYDAAENLWTEAAPLSTARCFFASEVLDEKIYAIGGLDSNVNPHSWDIYNPLTNSCTTHSGPTVCPYVEDSIVLNGKIYIRIGASAVLSRVYALVYEPSHGAWQTADTDIVSGWWGPAVVVDGTLYVLDERSGARLMMWQADRREWVAVGRLSPLLMQPPCRLVAIGKSIFFIGKGLSTLVLDVSNAGNVGGVMVSSSVTDKISDDEVMRCKCLAI